MVLPRLIMPEYCPFCDIDRQTITENAHAFAIYDKYPVAPGHALIIPKRHVADYFELTEEEHTACHQLVREVRLILMAEQKPDAFNLGVNIGRPAGQTVMHVHIHLIPRYTGDMTDPRGGVRGVIPEKQKY